MSETPATSTAQRVARGFTETASDYEEAVRYNHDGIQRLIASLPPGEYPTLLDVGCGTGWSSFAFLARFGSSRIIGVDPSSGMLDVFRSNAEELDGMDVELHEAEVMDMPVRDEVADAVLCTMAMHWFPDKPGAVAEMAARLKPGGVLAVLAGGEGVESEFRDLMADLDPPVPSAWVDLYDTAPTSERQMLEFLDAAGLEPLDVWIERRLRRTPVEAFLERVRVVSSHLNEGLDPAEVEHHGARVRQATIDAAGPDGFEYHFCKLFAMARKPA